MDIVERIRLRATETKKKSPLDFLSRERRESGAKHDSAVDRIPGESLTVTHLGTGHFQHLSDVSSTEFIELKTDDPSKLRYLRLIVALLESSNYDEAISSIAELKELG